MASAYKTPPAFDMDSKPYNHWIEEVKAWVELTDLAKAKQGLALALSLPEKDSSNIRDKVFSDVSLKDLKSDDGVKKLIKFKDNLLKKDELSEAYEIFSDFERSKWSPTMTMDTYTMELDKLYNKTKKFAMVLPESVKAFKLLEGAGLEQKDWQLVLTSVNYENSDTLYKQMTSALKKFFGRQSLASSSVSGATTSIKVEPSYIAEDNHLPESNEESALLTRSYYPPNNHFRGGVYNRRGQSGSIPTHGYGNRKYQDRDSIFSSSRGLGYLQDRSDRNQKEVKPKRLNPIRQDGNPIRCRCCEPICHLVKDCPDSYQNQEKGINFVKTTLFTRNQGTEMQVFFNECLYSAVLDSGCSATVAGEDWL